MTQETALGGVELGSQSGEAEVRCWRCWRMGVACSRHRVAWAGLEEGWAGPCSLCSGHRFSVTAGLGCRFWPLSPDGLGFTGPLEEPSAALAAVRFSLGWWIK